MRWQHHQTSWPLEKWRHDGLSTRTISSNLQAIGWCDVQQRTSLLSSFRNGPHPRGWLAVSVSFFPPSFHSHPYYFWACWRGRLLVACKWINCEWKWSTIQTEQRERKLKHNHVSVFNLPSSGFHFQSFTNQFRKFVTDQSTKLLYILFCSVYSNCGFHFSESRCY